MTKPGKIPAFAMAMLLAGFFGPPALAQSPMVAIGALPASDGAHITVSSQSWTDGGEIPLENTQFGGNSFPGLAWSAGPEGTRSYVVIVQDSDASDNGAPVTHMTLYNIPPDMTRLNAGMVAEGNPRGSSYGPNYMGSVEPYAGPHPPPGAKHHYHFQVFALDTAIPASPGIGYDGLLSAMRGHVLASGEIVGLSEAHAALPQRPVTGAAPARPTHRHEY